MHDHRSPAQTSGGGSAGNRFRDADLRVGRHRAAPGRLANAVLALVIVELTAATAYIHLTLGGTLFALNALGYAVLAGAYAATVVLPIGAVQRFGWLPRLGLAGYALLTIAAYLLSGPYFALGWIAKGIEVAIVGLLVVDTLGTYGSLGALLRAAVASLPLVRPNGGARHA